QRGAEIPGAPVRLLTADDVAAQYPRIRGIREEGPVLSLGALTTFTEFAEHEAVRRLVPRIDRFLWLIASRPIRNRATLGGNIVNASPIGDMTNLLLALGATLVLAEGDDRRDVALRDLYRGYKQLDKRPGELLVEIRLARETAHTLTNFEKVSKRKALDIASVCSGARFEREAGVLTHAAISMGGVGPTPKLLTRTGIFLQGKRLSPAVVGEALSIAAGEATPIDDVRGSARYKRLLARQLLLAHFTELFDEIDPLAHMGPELAAAQ
ncbi:MAG: FAD binding domain-containing protein, partial [Myxococcota bacterium]